MKEQKLCFIISPIGEEESETRKRSDQVFQHIFAPAAEACGYKALRADKLPEPGIITNQVIQHLVQDPLVLADLTGSNPNVFYELAIRHLLRKPLVQIIEKGEKIPFDVAGMRTIQVNYRDLTSAHQATLEIQNQIRAVEDKDQEAIESPISLFVRLQVLKDMSRSEDHNLSEVLSALVQMRLEVSAMGKHLVDPELLLPVAYLKGVLRAHDPAVVGEGRRMELKAEMRGFLDELRTYYRSCPPEQIQTLRQLTDRGMRLLDELDRIR